MQILLLYKNAIQVDLLMKDMNLGDSTVWALIRQCLCLASPSPKLIHDR